ncbi:MAG TPA: DnaA/Hda family protein, partial [Trueperaceae bacterium]|nr:DnaA/Hda family protein [Trueperaceae bacterium]
MAGKAQGMWDDVIARIRAEIPEVEFRTWFSQVTPQGIEGGAFVLGVPHSFARDWLKSNYGDVIETALRELGVEPPRVAFQVTGSKVIEQQDMFSTPPTPETRAESPEVRRPKLNPKYVFSHFVVGPNNNLAHAAARAVVEAPGKAYNPLFLYGESGLGKTHLMHAVGHAVFESRPDLQIE